jgi:hypothetical protein
LLAGIIAAATAPAIVKADSLMRIYVPSNRIVQPYEEYHSPQHVRSIKNYDSSPICQSEDNGSVITVIKTIRSSGGDFSSIAAFSAWLGTQDLTASNTKVECRLLRVGPDLAGVAITGRPHHVLRLANKDRLSDDYANLTNMGLV